MGQANGNELPIHITLVLFMNICICIECDEEVDPKKRGSNVHIYAFHMYCGRVMRYIECKLME